MLIAILGAGMIVRAVAIDLQQKYSVTSFDVTEESLDVLTQKNRLIKTVKTDLSNFENYITLLQNFDYVICAVNGLDTTPMEFTSKLLFNQWKLGQEEPEFTLMQINISDKTKTITYNLYDEYDATTKTSSMSRTTGYTATAALNMIINGHFKEKGVFSPELVGKYENCFNYMLGYHKEKNVIYTRSEVVN